MHQCCSQPTPSPSTPHYFHLCSAPSAFQHTDTVCLSLPYLRAMSLKLGLMPASLHMLNSPIMPLSTDAPSVRPSRTGTRIPRKWIAPSPWHRPAHRDPHPMIKIGYFSVVLPWLTFLRPGETLKNQENEGKNPQKSGSFLSWDTQPCSIARKTAKKRELYFFARQGC